MSRGKVVDFSPLLMHEQEERDLIERAAMRTVSFVSQALRLVGLGEGNAPVPSEFHTRHQLPPHLQEQVLNNAALRILVRALEAELKRREDDLNDRLKLLVSGLDPDSQGAIDRDLFGSCPACKPPLDRSS